MRLGRVPVPLNLTRAIKLGQRTGTDGGFSLFRPVPSICQAALRGFAPCAILTERCSASR